MRYLASRPLAGQTGHEAGRALLARLYREATGEALPPIAVTDRGKPYFTQGCWHFSISHTPRRVFCALATENIAVDAEETDRTVHPRLAGKILSEGERARYEASADKNAALLRLWVLKEAEAKLSGQGLRGYPSHTDFSPEDPRVQVLDGCYVALLTESGE